MPTPTQAATLSQYVVRAFTLSSLVKGLIGGAFAILCFDERDPMAVLVVGSHVAGHVDAAVTPLSIYLPAFNLFVLPALLPGGSMPMGTGQPTCLALAGLTQLFLFSMLNCSHVTNRLRRGSMQVSTFTLCGLRTGSNATVGDPIEPADPTGMPSP